MLKFNVSIQVYIYETHTLKGKQKKKKIKPNLSAVEA